MMLRTRAVKRLTIAVAALAMLQGCGEKPPNGPRVPTFPVVGQVLVDGKPAEFLCVKCEPLFEKSAAVPDSGAFTDKDGRFALFTFESGDGVPAGKYKLTFMWGSMNLMSGQYGPPDKLNNRYRKAADSPVEVEVSNKRIEVGTIELSSKK
jgi:hypothetical protein